MATRLFGTSIELGAKTVAQIAKIIREHWSVENLNHWKRDATYWREDRAPKRNPKGAKNLAFNSLNDAFDYYREEQGESLKIIKTASPYPE